jgi:hypothetical protein
VVAGDGLVAAARAIAMRRHLDLTSDVRLDHPAVPMDPALASLLESAVKRAGHPVHRMPSGAGHDAMIVAARMPAAMLFVRSPGGIRHHPDETVHSRRRAAVGSWDGFWTTSPIHFRSRRRVAGPLIRSGTIVTPAGVCSRLRIEGERLPRSARSCRRAGADRREGLRAAGGIDVHALQ